MRSRVSTSPIVRLSAANFWRDTDRFDSYRIERKLGQSDDILIRA